MSTSKTWPGGSTNVTPTTYSIPAAGEVNWANLSNFLNALGDGAQATTFQKFAVRVATTTPVTFATNDCIVATNMAVASAVAVNLPAGSNKLVAFIVDRKGDAKTNNITITPNGAETINGAATLVLNGNNQGVMLVFNSGTSDWEIVLNSKLDGGSVGGFTASRAIVSDSGGYLTSATTTATEIGYVNGVTSAIQTQIDTKQTRSVLTTKGDLYVATASDTVTRQGVGTDNYVFMADSGQATGVKYALIANANVDAAAAIALSKLAAVTASRALVSDGSGFVSAATTTATEIGYVNGVTSSIQTQLNAKASSSLTSAHIYVGSAGGVATDVAMSGDISISNTGSTSIVATTNGTITTLSALTTASSLATVGTITSGTWSATTIAVNKGGTGLTSGTSGGILGFTASGTIASSNALTANQLIIGGGAGATPSTLAAGSQFQVLVMGAANPGYGQVNLGQSAAITGTLPVGNGGTGLTSGTSGGILGYTASGTLASSAALTVSQLVIGGGAGATPTTLAAGSSRQYLHIASGIPAWTSFTAVTISTVTASSHTGGFSANSSGTYTVPTNCIWLYVIMQGGGGGGGGSSNTNTSTIGNAGVATTFGTTFLSAGGGSPGSNSANATFGGAGGTASIAAGATGTTVTGNYGSVGNNASGMFSFGGNGGAGAGGGGAAGGGVGAAGNNGAAVTGGGGAGGGTGASSQYGGHGGGGGAWLSALINSSISATYSYAVGNGGGGGTASGAATTFNGGSGGSGYIYVIEGYS